MLYAVRETRQSGPGNMTANDVSVEANHFLITTVPGIRPVLLQYKQVDQATATQRQVVADQQAVSAPMLARRCNLTVIGADKLGLLDNV